MNERFMRPIHKINVPKVLLAKKFNFADKFLRYCAKNVSTCAKFCEDAPLLTKYINPWVGMVISFCNSAQIQRIYGLTDAKNFHLLVTCRWQLFVCALFAG